MVSVVACLAGGLVLLTAAALKVADGAGARAALATYGLHGQAAARAWAALVAVEAALGVAVAAGSDGAAWAAGGLMAAFAVAQAAAIVGGRRGAPCACFGAHGKLSRASVGRSTLLAAGFAALPLVPRHHVGTEALLELGLAIALLGLVGLTVVVLALAREVGTLRMAVAPQGALEIDHEGPEIGANSALVTAFGEDLVPGLLGLAVFTSEGCGLCRALAGPIAAFERHPLVVLRRLDEVRDAEAWAAADIPGSPYAVALDADGTVLAKGTFNTAAQLESVLAAGERRRGALRD
jgi:hypothetical protein